MPILEKRHEGKSKLTEQGQHKNFDGLLLDAIDDGLSALGDAGKASVYIYLESQFNIRKQEIPSKLNDFSKALERIFGLGARHLEVWLMENLQAELEVTCKWPAHELPLSKWTVPEITFTEYVHRLREHFEAANHAKTEMGVLVNEQEKVQK